MKIMEFIKMVIVMIFIIFVEMQAKRERQRRPKIRFESHLEEFQQYLIDTGKNYSTAIESQRGIALCGYNKMSSHTFRQIWWIRYLFNSSLPIIVYHCSELNDENIHIIKLLVPDIQVVDMCSDENRDRLSLTSEEAAGIFRGFHCKIGAILLSPFEEVMTLDLDVIWFKSPDILFESDGYKKTGSLFFRDRIIEFKGDAISDKSFGLDVEKLDKFFESRGITIDKDSINDYSLKNGINIYWNYSSMIHGYGSVFDIQESSVVLINKNKMNKTLSLMKELLKEFKVGYGDKEWYWVLATAAGDEYSFEPFMAGQYGDCAGVVMHYDPTETKDPAAATPMFINAEHTVEFFNAVGEYMYDEITAPVLVEDLYSKRILPKFDPWAGPRHGNVSCTCANYKCENITSKDNNHMNEYIALAQWSLLAMETNHHTDLTKCVPVHVRQASTVEKIFEREIKNRPELCFFLGCPLTPIKIHDKDGKWDYGFTGSKYCDPFIRKDISNATSLPFKMAEFEEVANEARTPTSKWNRNVVVDDLLIQILPGRDVYLTENGTLHAFPDINTFVAMGYDFFDDDIIKVNGKNADLIGLVIGDPLPPL